MRPVTAEVPTLCACPYRPAFRTKGLRSGIFGAAILLDGVVAQLVERLVRNEKVRGSNPLGSTIHSFLLCFSHFRMVA